MMDYEQAMERLKAFIRQHDSSTDPDIGLDMALGAIQYRIDEIEHTANRQIAVLERAFWQYVMDNNDPEVMIDYHINQAERQLAEEAPNAENPD